MKSAFYAYDPNQVMTSLKGLLHGFLDLVFFQGGGGEIGGGGGSNITMSPKFFLLAYPLIWSKQFPPLRHGSDAHSSMLISHLVPLKPRAQMHW